MQGVETEMQLSQGTLLLSVTDGATQLQPWPTAQRLPMATTLSPRPGKFCDSSWTFMIKLLLRHRCAQGQVAGPGPQALMEAAPLPSCCHQSCHSYAEAAKLPPAGRKECGLVCQPKKGLGTQAGQCKALSLPRVGGT